MINTPRVYPDDVAPLIEPAEPPELAGQPENHEGKTTATPPPAAASRPRKTRQTPTRAGKTGNATATEEPPGTPTHAPQNERGTPERPYLPLSLTSAISATADKTVPLHHTHVKGLSKDPDKVDHMPAPPVRHAERGDIPRLSDTLARAFYTDPVMDWATRTGDARLEALRDMFRFGLEAEIRYGETTTTGDLLSCALWAPPEQLDEPHGPLDALLEAPRLIHYSGLSRFMRMRSFLDACHDKRPKTPHFYLDAIGVHPDRQGQGYASTLLTHTLTKLDDKGIPAYLESSNPRNNPLYQRHGFQITDEIHLKNGPTLWCMWRKPTKQQGTQHQPQNNPKKPRK